MKRLDVRGITVLELLLVIILAGIIFAVMYSRVEIEQKNSRNKEREGDLKAIQLGIESYYAQTGVYPKQAQVYDVQWRSDNLPGVDTAIVSDPSGQVIGEQKGYQYTATKDGSAACDTEADKCSKYLLVAALEDKPQYELSSLN